MTQSSGQLDAAICSKCCKKLDASQGCARTDSQAVEWPDVIPLKPPKPCCGRAGILQQLPHGGHKTNGQARNRRWPLSRLVCGSVIPPSSALVGSRLLPKTLRTEPSDDRPSKTG